MRCYIGIIALFLCFVPYGKVDADDDFSVLSWNLEWFFDHQTFDNRSDLAKKMTAPNRDSWLWRRDAVADSLASVAASVIAVQEAEGSLAMRDLSQAIGDRHRLKYRVVCVDGSEPFTEQDVAVLHDRNVWLRKSVFNGQSRKMYASRDFYNVSKHIECEFEIGDPKDPEVVTIINLHLRASAEQAAIRIRQARLVHAWIADRVAAGENVIVLGDFNTEEPYDGIRDGSDLATACGRHTPQKNDDLIDLHSRLPVGQRQTHLLPRRAFDRILVSPSLLHDDPSRTDLVFKSMERPVEMAVKGAGPDNPNDHWNSYWKLDASERDLSDHWPLLARFELK